MAKAITNSALSEDIGDLKARMKNNEERLKDIQTKMDTLVDIVAESKGSLRMLLGVASFIGALSAFIASVATWIIGRH